MLANLLPTQRSVCVKEALTRCELENRHQLGEKPLSQKVQAEVDRKDDAEERTDEAVGDNTPGLSTKDLNGAPRDTQVKSAPAKK